ncbi:hypothetical protein Salbus254_4773 [Streptomyces albidoflavus]|uniref:DUF6251 family protein n=1 Tax=Streptomyces albidoflavus TaxID=1886 RepID=UPI000775CC5F|nr:DUF6251 family protein [Streptomyces albidoflavus]AMM11227.1 hypothetical protein Salbus254_4773 [Streptomyces albidoflavus]
MEPTPNLPVRADIVQLRDGTHIYTDQLPQAFQQQSPQVVHIHQATPDRTTQRIALGTGIGAGTVAAGVYFGPLLVGVLTSMAISLAVVALVAVATAWGLVTVVRTVAQDGDQATKNLRKARRRRR